MAKVNMTAVRKKIKAYAACTGGKMKMKEAVQKKMKEGGRTSCGSEIPSYAKMAELAEELIRVIRNAAASYDLPESVMAHFNSLQYVVTELGDFNYECSIYFTDNLSRESLLDGEGINNIVALFNNGYVASSYAYGWWNGHKATGTAETMYRSTDSDAFIRSMIGRPSLHFMQAAINDFVSKYKKYNISVFLNESEYDGNYAGSPNGYITQI